MNTSDFDRRFIGKLTRLLSVNRLSPTLLVLLAMDLLSNGSFAQEAQGATASDEETIRSLEEQERLGILKPKLQALERIWSENSMVNTPMNLVSPNRSVAFDLLQQGMIDYSAFDRSIEHIRFDGEVVIVMGGETVQPIGAAPRQESDQKSCNRMFLLERVFGALPIDPLPRSHSSQQSPLTAAGDLLQSRPETRTRKVPGRSCDGISRVVPRFAGCLYGDAGDQSARHRRCLYAHSPPIYGLAR